MSLLYPQFPHSGLEIPLLFEAVDRRYDVVGIDLSPGMVEEAKRIISEAGGREMFMPRPSLRACVQGLPHYLSKVKA